jgi:hypothetical protein
MVVAIDTHMANYLSTNYKKHVEDVLLNGGFGVNIIIEQLRLRLRLPKPNTI